VINLLDSLPAGCRTLIEALYRNPEPILQRVDQIPLTLCHYDFDNRNLGIRNGPEGKQTVVIDWEILGRGISSSDVMRFLVYQQPPNADDLIEFYLDELEKRLGRRVDREQWREGSDLAVIAEWQIRGVIFGVMVSAPSAPVPDDQREDMKKRVSADINRWRR